MIDFHEAPARLAEGQRVYAIGDIHGCAERLWALHAAIAGDLAARPVARPLLLHVGDYVDRGPDSAAVVRRLAAGDPLPGVPTVNLMGNHERTMIDALDGAGASATDWMISGGREALASWGGDPDAPRATWRAHVPEPDLAFLRGLALSHRLGGYLFAHAGIRPGVALDRQSGQDLLTIRNSFLYSEQDFGVVVVHGHTPRMAPEVRFNRIGIDTGAVFGGKLTCAVLEGALIGFLQI
ncbi:MAG: metallophosphoesterase [Acetobacteraceae bacterium]|nr:metallophosphoesterase [Acetobacteraceae bacterium]